MPEPESDACLLLQNVKGAYVSSTKVKCTSPMYYGNENVPVTLLINGKPHGPKAQYLVCKYCFNIKIASIYILNTLKTLNPNNSMGLESLSC